MIRVMFRFGRGIVATAWLCAGAALAAPTPGGPRDAPPPPAVNVVRGAPAEMMSPDNAAFCAHLSDMAALYRRRLASNQPEADALAERGRQLCAAGRMRSGIWHLRHALRELRDLPPR